MSRKALLDFIRAAEHSSNLRREIKKCETIQNLISLAYEYGFNITLKDLYDESSEKILDWFQISHINPIKNNIL
tara:strand:- start:60 stop:281 length:222 start_codon:yes stop_codon:yes gene_type:complete